MIERGQKPSPCCKSMSIGCPSVRVDPQKKLCEDYGLQTNRKKPTPKKIGLRKRSC